MGCMNLLRICGVLMLVINFILWYFTILILPNVNWMWVCIFVVLSFSVISSGYICIAYTRFRKLRVLWQRINISLMLLPIGLAVSVNAVMYVFFIRMLVKLWLKKNFKKVFLYTNLYPDISDLQLVIIWNLQV